MDIKRIKRYVELVHLVVFIIGIIILLIGLLVTQTDVRNILQSIGCSIIASSVIAFFTARYFIREINAKDIIQNWGIINIYKRRSEADSYVNDIFEKYKGEILCCPMSFNGFYQVMRSNFEEKLLRKELKIKFLLINPNNVAFITQREKDEGRMVGSLLKDIVMLLDYLKELQKNYPESVMYKLHDHLPMNYFYQLGESLFVGSYLVGLSSRNTITYVFKNGT